MAEDFEDAGQRYTFLLRPVKDLGKNFETNIAKELDDYCERLRSVSDDAHEGVDNQHRFNFAEAAMLIQGSAYVFGKKVDYVHSQAIHFFEALQPQKTKKKKKKKGEEEEDEGFVDGDATSIDPCDLQDCSKVKACKENSLLRNFEKSKYKGHPPKIKVMPMSLMPLSDNEKNGVLIYSTGYRMEIVGKMDDFKMNAGFLNSRGVLLLQLADNKIVDEFASEAFLRMWHPYLFNPDGTFVAKPCGAHYRAVMECLKKRLTRSQAPSSGRGTLTGDSGSDHGRIPSAMEIGRASSAMEVARRGTTGTFNDLQSARPSTRLLEAPEIESQKVNQVPEGGEGFDSFDGGMDCGDFSLPVPSVPCEKRAARSQQPCVMPWEINENDAEEDCTQKLLLDPFDTVKWKTKPIEKIERFVRGSTIAARMEKKEKNMTFQKRTMRTNEYVKEHFFMRKKVKKCKEDDWQAEALYRFIVAVMKKRAEAKREKRKAKANPVAEAVYNDDDDDYNDDGEDYDDVNDEPENNENIPPRTDAAGTQGTQGSDDPKKSVETVPNAPEVRKSVIDLMFGDMDDEDLDSSISIDSLYGGCGPSQGPSQGLSQGDSQPIGDKGKKKFSLLELLHAHMLKYWSTTEEVTSDLVARVQEWEETMMPILEEEETRKEFDIHEYGDELLSMFKEVGEVKTLDELLVGRKKYEISRYFLACLMMANTYNVRVEHEIRKDRTGVETPVMRITLLKKNRHHEVFDKAGAL
nr:Protein of unknown function DUF1032 domain containing protein [Haemonchus contortus]